MLYGNIPKPLRLRSLVVDPPIALAPMVGLSHSVLRSVVQHLGGVGLFFTEMLAAKRLPHDSPRLSPLLISTAAEQPLIYQLVVGKPAYIQSAVDKIHSLGGQGIDLNLGCPAPMQRRQGAGARLAENIPVLGKILTELRAATDLPVSVKIRLGYRGREEQHLDFCKFIEDQGVDYIIVHARYVAEKFCRKPNWRGIAPIKMVLSIPVLANGGIFSVDDGRRCLAESGADGLMIGRGAVESPWLCGEISKEIYGIGDDNVWVDKEQIYCQFIDLLQQRFPVEKQLVRLKHFTLYYAKSFQFGHHLATGVQSSQSIEAAKEKAIGFFQSRKEVTF
jgi:tRNA-dihydrouridine synthase B